MRWLTVVAETSYSFSFFRSRFTWISLFLPPITFTRPICGTCSSFGRMTSSAKSKSLAIGRSAVSVMATTGWSEGDIRLMVGSLTSEGSFFFAVETRSLTCCSAYLMSVSRLNSTTTMLTPSRLVLRNVLIPEIPESSSSRTLETLVSSSFGPAPG